MTILATFQFESGKRYYKCFTYCCGVKNEKVGNMNIINF